jgi:glycyl-tRNA synthetase beta chain
MADVPRRRHTIRKALDHATRTVAGLRWREDEPLVDAVTHLTEWPTAVLGSFEPEYLTLPEEVLVTVMRDHQKYFAVEEANGTLAPHFLAVLNTAVDDPAIIRHGNERVLRARFNDARFFWNFDQKISLEGRVEMLKAVTFQKDLGSYYAKTERTSGIVDRLAQLAVSRDAIVDSPSLTTAARLAKTDLTTELVKEFTELQGVVGGLYARAQGHSQAVSAAIYSQYQPASAGDPIPPTIEGLLLGLADRIGTVIDMFAIGFAPSGSKDPYALRRAGNAIVKLLAEGALPLTLADVIGAPNPAVAAFLADRVEFYLRDARGFSFDVVKAVLAADADDVRDALARAEALSTVRASDDFSAIAAAFKRSKNILRQAAEKSLEPARLVDKALLSDAAEQALHAAATALIPVVEAHRAARSYSSALAEIATLRPHVDLFFDRVMVMVDDPALRANRLALIATVLLEFSKIADFSEMSVQA